MQTLALAVVRNLELVGVVCFGVKGIWCFAVKRIKPNKKKLMVFTQMFCWKPDS